MINRENDITNTEVIELVSSFKNATGIEFIKEGIKWVATGAFMGTSDAIPGYSGGTSLSLLGFYRKLILIAKSCFVPELGITRIKALMFLVPFLCGWVAGVFGFAKLTEMMAEQGLSLELLFFFSPFILFTIPVFLKAEEPKLWEGKKIIKTKRWIWFIAGVLVIVAVGLITLFYVHGVDFAKVHGENVFPLKESLNWLKLIVVAYGAGMVALIPGGSGALIQFISGMYKNIHWTIMAHADQNLAGLFLFALFTFLGMITMVFIMAWGLKKHKHKLAALSLGMLLASTIVMFMIPNDSLWGEISQTRHYIGIPISVVLGSATGIGLNIFVNINRKRIRVSRRKS